MGRDGGKNAALPLPLMTVFQDLCPHYMAMGMTYEQYWDGDVYAHKMFRQAKKVSLAEQNYIAWLQGMYIYEAIIDIAPYIKAFSKARPKPYPQEPYDIFKEDVEAREEREQRERYEHIKERVAAFAKAQKEKRENLKSKGEDDSAGCIS